jgi:hypothetical protein
MGRQLEFYMTPADEKAFLLEVTKREGAVLIKARSTSSEPHIIGALPSQGSPEAREGVVLWDPKLGQPLMNKRGNFYFVDKSGSPIIEFMQSEPGPSGLRRGRIWIDTCAAENSAELATWFESLRRWLRKNHKRNSDGFYVGPNAEKAGSLE